VCEADLDSARPAEFEHVVIPPEGYVLRPRVLYLGVIHERTHSERFAQMINGDRSLGSLGVWVHVLFAADLPTQAEVLRQPAETADMVVVPTTAMSARLRRFTDIPAKRIAHIPWGIPDHLLTARADRQLGRQGTFRVLHAGRLTAEKAPAELFQALAELDGVELTVAAPESEYAALTARAELSRVHHLGWLSRPRLWSEFDRHDLLVVPSTRLEAFGLVAVEAQARGLPVLYRPVDGLTEVLGVSAQAVSANGGGPVPADTDRPPAHRAIRLPHHVTGLPGRLPRTAANEGAMTLPVSASCGALMTPCPVSGLAWQVRLTSGPGTES
jgi:glycosyltransferase involved in cell wall biosynthesis